MVPESATVAPAAADPLTNTTFFSTKEFVEAWVRAFRGQYRSLAIPVKGSGPPRTMYAIQSPGRYWSRQLPLTRFDFFLSPGWVGNLERSTLEGILDVLTGTRTRGFIWNVRFDHEPLARGLSSLGLTATRISTHVIPLARGYEHVFSCYSSTIRNQIRKARRRGVTVRQTDDPADVLAYSHLYMRLAGEKGWKLPYPAELSLELTKLSRAAKLFVAEHDDRLIAGAFFVRDGTAVTYYLHSAQDPAYANLLPSRPVMDEAIRWGCESGATMFNLGMSGGVASLEEFKSHWGAHSALNWSFQWTNPIWTRLANLKSAVLRPFDASEQ